MGLSEIKLFEATVVTEDYVDDLTSLVTGGGIHRNSGNQLQLDQNVYRHSTILAQNWTKFLPIAGSDPVTSTYRITNSTFTVPDKF